MMNFLRNELEGNMTLVVVKWLHPISWN